MYQKIFVNNFSRSNTSKRTCTACENNNQQPTIAEHDIVASVNYIILIFTSG